MFKAIYQLEELGSFGTLVEAFKVIYDAIQKEKVLTWQILETTIWIEITGLCVVYSFYEARDVMYSEGHLIDGKWVD